MGHLRLKHALKKMHDQKAAVYKSLLYMALTAILIFVAVSKFGFLPITLAQQVQAPSQQEWTRPMRLEVEPLAQTKGYSTTLPVKVSLFDVEGNPAKAQKPVPIKLESVAPSGEKSVKTVEIPAGQDSTNAIIGSGSPGVVKVEAMEADHHLLSGSDYVVAGRKISTSMPTKDMKLEFTVSGDDGSNGVLADGKSSAHIKVLAICGQPPSSDIRVWLNASVGEVNPNPLIIKKGQTEGSARWRSKTVAEGSIEVATTVPADLEFLGSTKQKLRFSPLIWELRFANAPDVISIVDEPPVTLRLYDRNGSPVLSDAPRRVRFISRSPILRANPTDAEISAGASDASTMLLATYTGETQVEASTAGYPPTLLKLKVNATVVIILCIAGGVGGGFLAFVKSRGNILLRIGTGILVGLLASWVYVYLGITHLNPAIAHSQLSVLFISIFAAFSGVKAVAGLSKLLNLGF